MTIQEASERCRIPLHILQEYERWGALPRSKGRDGDLERLSLSLTLHDVGFTPEEVEHSMRLLLVGGFHQRRARPYAEGAPGRHAG